jgi:hypothetical protein
MRRPEEVYDREAVLGRDATSVFPTEARQGGAAGQLDTEAIKEAIGARKFISETEARQCAESNACCRT